MEGLSQRLRRLLGEEEFVGFEDAEEHELADAQCLRVDVLLAVDEAYDFLVLRYHAVSDEYAIGRVVVS